MDIQHFIKNYKDYDEDEIDFDIFKDFLKDFFIYFENELSEDFIDYFSDKVDWFWISCTQVFSEKFIEKYVDKFNWFHISEKMLSGDFLKKHKIKIMKARNYNEDEQFEKYLSIKMSRR